MKQQKLLERNGWTVECESPFEIRHKDGSFAKGQAADIVEQSYIDQQLIPFKKLERLCDKARVVFVLENENSDVVTAVRCLQTLVDPLKSRTHNIKYDKINGRIWWENNNSQDWDYQFANPQEAENWWKATILRKVVDRSYEIK